MNMLRRFLRNTTRFVERESYKNILFGGGNPLLDITAEVDTEYVLSYGLKPNSSILAEEQHKEMYDEMIKKYNVNYTGGGATQNVFRCFSWMMGEEDTCTYVGCVGEDEYGEILKTVTRRDGVNTLYLQNPYQDTGRCACFIHGEHRTLVADLGASEKYDYRHFKLDKVQEKMDEAELFYFSGYFLSACPHAILDIALHAFENDKILGLNLSAEFIIEEFMAILLPTMYSSDYIFGNETEARCMAKKLRFKETHSVEGIAHTLASRLPKVEGKPKTVIFTQGGLDDIIVAKQDEEDGVDIFSFPIIPVDNVVDTNGAGDSFVGGFLSQVAKNEPLEKCVKAGMFASRVCIQANGVVYPDEPPKFIEL